MILNKIKTREEITTISAKLKSQGKIIGFTSGVFDLLHYGHVSYLEKAKIQCDFLIVAVNSDESVKKYKGNNRPIIPEKERLSLIAALECVDYVFLFSERRNKDNILAIRPDLYIKAGDYKESELTSAQYMEEWKGKVVLIPLEQGLSTSNIINRILGVDPPKEPCVAVFLDRDGVLNEKVHFLHEPEKLKILPGVIEGLKKIQGKFKLVIVTNQQGIGLGYYTKEDLFKVNSKMLGIFSEHGIVIDKIYFCPHSLSEGCTCRKPGIGMFLRAKEELNIDMPCSFMIGDQSTDILAGKEAGVKTILIADYISAAAVPSKRVSNFADAIAYIEAEAF